MRRTACLGLGALLMVGCTTNPDGTQSVNKTAVGAVVGGLAGGAVGNRLDRKGNRTAGTLAGVAVGAAAGAGIGYMMDRQEKELRQQLEGERVANAIAVERVREDLLKLTLDSEVSFDFDSAALKPTFRPSLEKLADVLARYDRNRVTIVGHTDAVGSETYNEHLSVRRAEAVMNQLATYGVPPSVMTALGKGEREPRATNETEAGRQLNRRVEVYVQPIEAS